MTSHMMVLRSVRVRFVSRGFQGHVYSQLALNHESKFSSGLVHILRSNIISHFCSPCGGQQHRSSHHVQCPPALQQKLGDDPPLLISIGDGSAVSLSVLSLMQYQRAKKMKGMPNTKIGSSAPSTFNPCDRSEKSMQDPYSISGNMR